jgi:hypothetical protein
LIRGVSKAAGAISGHDPETIEKFARGAFDESTPEYKAMMEAAATRDGASREIRAHVDDMLSASRDVTDEARGPLKRGYVRKAVAGVDADAAAQSSRGLADRALTALDEMQTNPEDFGGKTAVSHAMTVASRISGELDGAIRAGDVAEQFALVDDMKKAIGKYAKGASRLSPAMATDELVSSQNRARAVQLQQIYETLRTGLEDESVWKKAATDQQALNAAWTEQIEASQRFHKALTTEVGRDPGNPFGPELRGVDPAKADAYVRNLMSPAQDLTHKAVRDYVSSTAKLADTIDGIYELPASKAAQVAQVKRSAAAFGETLDRTEQQLALTNQFEAMRARTDGAGTAMSTITGLAGLALGHVPGAIAGSALGKGVANVLTRPAETILQLANIAKMVRESNGRIVRSLRQFGRGAARSARTLDVASYERRTDRIRSTMASPDTLAERIGTNLGGLRTTAPKLTDAMTGVALTGLRFLNDKLPPEPPGDPFEPHRKMPPPPPGQKEKWLRYYDAVKDPLSVLDDLRDGRVNPEGIEAMKTVYPSMFGNIRQHAFDLISSGKLADLSKQQRIGLAMTLDIAIPELSPAYIAARQLAYQTPPGDGGGAPAPKVRTKAINLEKMAPQLVTDRIESGGAGG